MPVYVEQKFMVRLFYHQSHGVSLWNMAEFPGAQARIALSSFILKGYWRILMAATVIVISTVVGAYLHTAAGVGVGVFATALLVQKHVVEVWPRAAAVALVGLVVLAGCRHLVKVGVICSSAVFIKAR